MVFDPVVNVGLEKMGFTTASSVPVCSSSNSCIKFPFVTFNGAAESWLVDSRLDRAWERWIKVKQSARVWVQGNWGGKDAPGRRSRRQKRRGSGYCIDLRHQCTTIKAVASAIRTKL